MSHADNRVVCLHTHGTDCPECQGAPLPLDRIATLLESAPPSLDPAALSRQTFARLQPELRRRALVTAWRRVGLGVLLSLVPLPLVLAYDAYILRLVYDVLSALLPATVAAYVVFSYAAFLILLFASTYAAIPLLVVQRGGGRPAATA